MMKLWWTLLHFSVYCTAISLKMTSYSQLSPGWRAYTSCSESGKNGNYIYRSSLCCVRLRYPPKQNPHKICQTWAQAQRAKIQFGTSSYPHLAGRATPMFYLSWAKRAPHWFSYMYTGWQLGYGIFLVNASLSAIPSICQWYVTKYSVEIVQKQWKANSTSDKTKRSICICLIEV